MSFFNALYTLASGRQEQPINESSRVTVQIANRSKAEEALLWLKWTVSLPVTVCHSLYNIGVMLKHRELKTPIGLQVYSGNQIHSMPFLFPSPSLHLVSSPKVMCAVAQHFRNDSDGPFTGGSVSKVLYPLLRDLFPETQSLQDQELQEMLILTCSRENVPTFRNVLLQFIGPQFSDQLELTLDQVMDEVLEWLSKQEKLGSITLSAKELTQLVTVATVSRFFLGHPGPFEEYQKIGSAVTFAFNFNLIKQLKTPPSEQVAQYEEALTTIRSALELSQGRFPDFLRHSSSLSSFQVKGLLFSSYAGGSDTTSAVLQSILWRLGQMGVAYQEELKVDEAEKLSHFISECTRIFAPAYISRFARENVDICVKNEGKKEWQYRIWKGNGIINAPPLAGKNEKLFDSPHSFNPDRFIGKKEPFPTHIFGMGAHKCPGLWLAKTEIRACVSKILKRYHIASLPNKKELNVTGFLSFKPEEVTLTFTRRTPQGC